MTEPPTARAGIECAECGDVDLDGDLNECESCGAKMCGTCERQCAKCEIAHCGTCLDTPGGGCECSMCPACVIGARDSCPKCGGLAVFCYVCDTGNEEGTEPLCAACLEDRSRSAAKKKKVDRE